MSANHETNGESRKDLDWLAFQYVSGELPADKADRFEARLLEEPDVAEAVAAAVALGEAVSLAFDDEAVSADAQPETISTVANAETVNRSSVGRTVSVLTAASVIVAALLISFRGEESPHNSLATDSESTVDRGLNSSVTSPEVNSLLLETWTEARETIAAMDSEAASEVVSIAAVESETVSADDVPDWLFVAVELSYDSALGNSNGSVLEN